MNELSKILAGIIGGFFGGFFIAKAIDAEKEKEKYRDAFFDKKPSKFWVFAKSVFGNEIMSFDNYDDAKKMFDKISKSGKFKYKDLVENSEGAKKWYDEVRSEEYKERNKEYITKPEENRLDELSDISTVAYVEIGVGDETIESRGISDEPLERITEK